MLLDEERAAAVSKDAICYDDDRGIPAFDEDIAVAEAEAEVEKLPPAKLSDE